MVAGLLIVRYLGIIDSDAEVTFSIFVFVFDLIVNLLVPSLYIDSTPCLKEYVLKCIQSGFDVIVDTYGFIFAKIVNSVYQFFTSFQHTNQIYPTIE